MGSNDHNPRGGRSRNRGGNDATNKRRLDAIAQSRTGFDISKIDWEAANEVTSLAMVSGGAIRLGLTRDGGALAVGVYSDGDHETVYLNATDDQAVFWLRIAQVFKPGDWHDQ